MTKTDCIHPNFQRTHFSSLPLTKTCIFCKELSDVVVHAFHTEGHCEKRGCVDLCELCQPRSEAG